MTPVTTRPRPDKVKFRWDIVLFFAYVFATMRRSTGLPWHEWLGVVFIPVLSIHLWLNWNWIADYIRRSTRVASGLTRFNRWWNTLQLLVAVVTLASGLLISRTFLPAVGLTGLRSNFLGDVHAASATVLTVMIGVHLGLHGHWIWSRLRGASRPTVTSDTKQIRRQLLLASAIVVAVLAAVLLIPNSNFYHQHFPLLRRVRDDFIQVIISMSIPGTIAFGALVFFQGRRS